MSAKALKIAFMGGKQAGIMGALTVLATGHKISAAVSYSEDLARILRLFKVPLYKSIKSSGFKAAVKSSDLLLCVHGREIVRQDLLTAPRLACINVHPFLYKYKGSDPVGRALRDGEHKASVGAHIMTEKIDHGKVLHECFFDIGKPLTVTDAYNILYPYYSEVLLRVLKIIPKR